VACRRCRRCRRVGQIQGFGEGREQLKPEAASRRRGHWIWTGTLRTSEPQHASSSRPVDQWIGGSAGRASSNGASEQSHQRQASSACPALSCAALPILTGRPETPKTRPGPPKLMTTADCNVKWTPIHANTILNSAAPCFLFLLYLRPHPDCQVNSYSLRPPAIHSFRGKRGPQHTMTPNTTWI
jgi:hypothetical protein